MEPYIQFRHLRCQAPQVGLEPTTSRLTAVRSTIELLRNKYTLKTATESTSSFYFGQAFDLLVSEGTRITPLTPLTYQPHTL